jgi:hypothetical protein
LRRRTWASGSVLWRIDAHPPDNWDWSGFPSPRNRFDPESGAFRVRYAALTLDGAARERYLSTGRYIPADHRDHQMVRLEVVRPIRVLDLRTEANLDALDVDDRISTGREPAVWDAAHRLADTVRRWWPDLDGVVYRSRTTPESSANLAFFSMAPFQSETQALNRMRELLTELVLSHGFTIGWEL